MPEGWAKCGRLATRGSTGSSPSRSLLRNSASDSDREARAIAALNHPNICQIYDVGPDYIVMEYVEGSEIKGPLPLDLALKAAIQLAGALEAAHRKSIIHRDLKPANVLTTKSGVKVLDFGLAKFEVVKAALGDETATRALTEEGTIVGTLQYMAPEQLQGKPTDARSDIFSFGCVLYEILTGERAFPAENKASLIAAIMDRDPEPLIPMTPPMLEHIVKKCLAKDPDDRWQSASDLKSELQWVLDSGSNPGMPAPVVAQRRATPASAGLLPESSPRCSPPSPFSITARYPRRPQPFASKSRHPEGTSWGQTDFPVISPDGSRMVFGATKRDVSHSLWVRPMDSVNIEAATIKIEQRVWHQEISRPKSEGSKRTLGIGNLWDRYRTLATDTKPSPDDFVFHQKRRQESRCGTLVSGIVFIRLRRPKDAIS